MAGGMMPDGLGGAETPGFAWEAFAAPAETSLASPAVDVAEPGDSAASAAGFWLCGPSDGGSGADSWERADGPGGRAAGGPVLRFWLVFPVAAR
jgi:hypothetical protein